jgi:bacteriorhodopsin
VFEFAEWLGTTPLSVAIQSTLWLTPLLQSIHILMIGVVFTIVLVIALRVLGRVRADEPLADIHAQFRPWFWSALAVMLVTGIVLSIGEPVREARALSFWIKMSLVVTGVVISLIFGRSLRTEAVAGGGVYSGRARVFAVATVCMWLFIIFLGRAIAYDVEVWGSWHLG